MFRAMLEKTRDTSRMDKDISLSLVNQKKTKQKNIFVFKTRDAGLWDEKNPALL